VSPISCIPLVIESDLILLQVVEELPSIEVQIETFPSDSFSVDPTRMGLEERFFKRNVPT
jgi:hypothetical protein